MDENEKRIRQKLKDNFQHYAAKCLKIRSKSGEIIPFILNKSQMYMDAKVENQLRDKGFVRAIILKGRQQGCSSYIEGRFYWRVTHRFGTRAFILTHDNDATNNLFEMSQRFHQYCPSAVRPTIEASNAKELIFAGLDSGYKLGTAGNKSVGRSSTIQLLHGSEVGYWPNASEHAKGILQAVPNEKGTEVFIESTAHGLGNYFHEQWQLAEIGQSDFIPIFVPWFWQDEYKRKIEDEFVLDDEEEMLKNIYAITNEQLNWRRYKIIELSAGGMNGKKAFMQEYPSIPSEAFQITGEDSFISPEVVLVSRKCKSERYGGLVIGVDPARFGDDRTSIIRRQGRCAYGLESYNKKDTMEVVGIVHSIIAKENPLKVCVDIGGLGAGIFDRLIELGHRDVLVPVNSGSTPLNQKKYLNKRAEMWGLMRDWLINQPCEIPDNDTLHADLCGIRYKVDSQSRLVMERKEDMKKRGIRSPDEADALALTFACPDTALFDIMNKKHDNTAKHIMGKNIRLKKLKDSRYI